MSKVTFELPNAPKPAGPYSQAALIERPLYLPGVVAFVQNEELGVWEMPESLTLAEETLQAIRNLERALGDLSLTLEHVGDMTVFVHNPTDERIREMNEAYAEGFKDVKSYPSRACIGGTPPFGLQVELKPVVALPKDYIIPTR